MYAATASSTSRGHCDPPGPSRYAAPLASAGKRSRIAATSSAGALLREMAEDPTAQQDLTFLVCEIPPVPAKPAGHLVVEPYAVRPCARMNGCSEERTRSASEGVRAYDRIALRRIRRTCLRTAVC